MKPTKAWQKECHENLWIMEWSDIHSCDSTVNKIRALVHIVCKRSILNTLKNTFNMRTGGVRSHKFSCELGKCFKSFSVSFNKWRHVQKHLQREQNTTESSFVKHASRMLSDGN